jgi:RNA polymerase sigma-70 factor, ECF subfamily
LAIQSTISVTATQNGSPSQTEEKTEQTSAPRYSREDWEILVSQIKAGEDAGMEQLYKIFRRGIRYHLCRQLGPQDLDDRVHDTFLIVVNAIRRGGLHEPERLMGFVRTIVSRQVMVYIEQAVHDRREHRDLETGIAVPDRKQSALQGMIVQQNAELMKSALSALSEKDREILDRFYLKEQSMQQICSEMELTETQFRLTKSRAKAKFGEIGRKKLASGGISSVLAKAQTG